MNKIVTRARDFPLEALESEDQKISVLNPVGYPPQIVRKALAPRLESLEGKTIWWIAGSNDSVELLRQVQAWFADHLPNVETRIISLSATCRTTIRRPGGNKRDGDAARSSAVQATAAIVRQLFPPMPSRLNETK